jgi:hypothetical protein
MRSHAQENAGLIEALILQNNRAFEMIENQKQKMKLGALEPSPHSSLVA